MTHIEGAIVINRAPEVVFDVVADERNEPRYNPRLRRVEKVSPGPIGAGTRFRAESTSMGRTSLMIIEITGYERPRRLMSSTRLASMRIHGTLTFDPAPGGTRMRWSWEVEPLGVLKLLTPLVAGMGRRQEQQVWAGLKRYVESHVPPQEVGRPPARPALAAS